MERAVHDMHDLFEQLGQAGDEVAIRRFIKTHSPLPGNVRLHEAGFWTSAQAAFLQEATSNDADWAAVADDLNILLHERH